LTGTKLFLDGQEDDLENFVELRNTLVSTRDNFDAPILIMGSSGSGKTTYAQMLLPNHLQRLFPHKKYFLVYLLATRNALPDPIQISNYVEERMKLKLQMDSTATVNPAELTNAAKLTNAAELTMVVVIDEVGLSSHAKQVSTRDALLEYQASLRSVLTRGNMAKDIQLVLVGTGLDKLTVEVNSSNECQKIRLTPWSQDTVGDYIDRVISNKHGSERAQTIKRLVNSEPVYKSLASNARSLHYLVDYLNSDLEMFAERLINRHFVVDRVIERYIKANRLRSLTEEGRRVVVMIVWKALSDAEWNTPQWPELKADRFYPDHEGIRNRIESCCYCLVDTNVESFNGGITFVGEHKLAVSVSNALALVLVRLTGNKASLCIGTEQFEVAAAIHELECSYSRCFQEGIKPPCIKVLPSQHQFPGTQKEKIKIPSVGIETIVINGPRATYCDVISKHRIVQAKYVGDPDKTYASLDLDDELGKAGVLTKEACNETMIARNKEAKNESYKKSSFLTRALVKMWEEPNAPGKTVSKQYEEERATGEIDLLDGTKLHGAGTRQVILTRPRSETFFHCDERDWNASGYEWSNERLPITVAFITNSIGFKISSMLGANGSSVDIRREHVDDNGMLLLTFDDEAHKNLGKAIEKMVLPCVSVRFYFLGN